LFRLNRFPSSQDAQFILQLFTGRRHCLGVTNRDISALVAGACAATAKTKLAVLAAETRGGNCRWKPADTTGPALVLGRAMLAGSVTHHDNDKGLRSGSRHTAVVALVTYCLSL
jgi:hypothetical protein